MYSVLCVYQMKIYNYVYLIIPCNSQFKSLLTICCAHVLSLAFKISFDLDTGHFLTWSLVWDLHWFLCLLCLKAMSVVELSVLDMVCGLSVLEAAIRCRTGQLSRRADGLTGVNSTGLRLIQASRSLQCYRNRWLTLFSHTQPCSFLNAHTTERHGCISVFEHVSLSLCTFT